MSTPDFALREVLHKFALRSAHGRYSYAVASREKLPMQKILPKGHTSCLSSQFKYTSATHTDLRQTCATGPAAATRRVPERPRAGATASRFAFFLARCPRDECARRTSARCGIDITANGGLRLYRRPSMDAGAPLAVL